MTYLEKIKELDGYFYAVQTIKACENEKRHWKDAGISMTSSSDEVKSKNKSNKSRVEKSADHTYELSCQISKQIAKSRQEKERVEKIINQINNRRYRAILEMRYMGFMTWSEIADAFNTTERNIYYLHKRALDKLDI